MSTMPSPLSEPKLEPSEPQNSEGLNPPSHEGADLPKIKTADENSSSVEASKVSPKGIDVVATGKGFYNQRRISEGEKFKIQSTEELGEWMKCVDPILEKKRIQILTEKKLKAKK